MSFFFFGRSLLLAVFGLGLLLLVGFDAATAAQG